MKNDTKKDKTPFAQRAAKDSWILFFIILIMTTLFGISAITDILGILLAVSGIVLGIVSMFGISKYGKKKILLPALIGIILNGLLFFIWVSNYIAYVARARQIISP